MQVIRKERKKWKSNYSVPRPIELPGAWADLVVSDERRAEILERDKQHSPVTNCFAGAKDGGKRGNAVPFDGQGIAVNGRIGVYIDGNKKRAVVRFPEGTEVVDRADIEDIDYPRSPRTKPQRFTDEDGDIHDSNGPSGGCVLKSMARVDAEEVTYSWAPSWAKASGSWAPLHARDLYQRKHHDDLMRRLCGDLHRCQFREALAESLLEKVAA
jgi:hypothetical protein